MSAIFFRTILIYLFLLFSMRIMGKRQIGDLQLNELIVTFMLSELAVGPITTPSIPLLHAIIPILLLLSIEVIISYLMTKSNTIKRLLSGGPAIFIKKGKLQKNVLAQNRYEIEELLSDLRLAGICDPAQVEYAILEESGRLSVIPKAAYAPMTPSTMGYQPSENDMAYPVIIDGTLQINNLKECGQSQKWLQDTLQKMHLTPEEIFLMTVTEGGSIYCVPNKPATSKQENSEET